jgi:uncharacterized membrane protein YjgN (DUF898 family)
MADTCPRCGRTGLSSDKCPQCGLVIPLYEAAIEKFKLGASAGRPAPVVPQPVRAPATPRLAAPSTAPSITRRPTFHGRGGTLFGIHIVNVCLTLATVGVYTFWGKVRVRRYLLSQSEIDGDRFAYHGTGRELLLGFVKAALVFFLPIIAVQVAAALSRDAWAAAGARIVSSIVFAIFVPVALVGARRYRLSRTSWRGIRFSFDGRAREYLRLCIRASFLMSLTLGLYYPIFHATSHAFMVTHARFGQRPFRFDGRARETFKPFLLAVLLLIPTLGLSWVWHLAWRRRFYWNHTTFEHARFRSTMTGGGLFWLYLVNAMLLIVTLGFAWPWVRVRNARFTFGTLALEGAIDLDGIVQTAPAGSATGDAVSSFFGSGFDFG